VRYGVGRGATQAENGCFLAPFSFVYLYKEISMELVELLSRDGQRVALIDIPHFLPTAEVLIWQDRHFVIGMDGEYYEATVFKIED
jgi:hypothetical protein